MDYPTLLRHLEGNLRLLDARGTKYIGLESLEGEELAELKEGLKRLVPKASKKAEAPEEQGSTRPRQKPAQMIRRFLDDQKSSQSFQKKISKPGAFTEKPKLGIAAFGTGVRGKSDNVRFKGKGIGGFSDPSSVFVDYENL